MNEIPDIITSLIVSDQYDIFWNDSSDLNEMRSKEVLVLSLPYAKDSEEEKQLLKMLGACNLKEEQYQVMQMQKEDEISWHKLREKAAPKSVIILGIELGQLGISVQLMPHQLSRFNDRSWIVTASLQDLIKDQNIKSHLWNYGLKPLFVDKVYG